MSFIYLNNMYDPIHSSWNSIFDTRDPSHFLRPSYTVSWNGLFSYLTTMYSAYNYTYGKWNLFPRDVWEDHEELLDYLYRETICTKYMFSFIAICGYSNTIQVIEPKTDGTWVVHAFPVSLERSALVTALNEIWLRMDSTINYSNSNVAPWLSTTPEITYETDFPIIRWLVFFCNQEVIYDEHTGGYVRPSDFQSYTDQYSLTYSLFDISICSLTGAIEPDRATLSQVFNYSQSPTKIFGRKVIKHKKRAKRAKKEFEAKGPSYGVELEVSCDHTPEAIVEAQGETPFFLLKHDSSVSGACRYCYEFVTRPMDFRAQRIAWGKFFANIWDKETKEYKGFDCSRDTNNGMHVHIGKDSFVSTQHYKRFLWFFTDPANHRFLTFVSERGRRMSSFCAFPEGFSNSRKKDFNRVESLVRNRGAIFPTQKGTVEVRIFKGFVSYATVMKNLEFVDSVFYFTQQASYCRTTADYYVKWLKETPNNKYKALKIFLKKVPERVLKEIEAAIRFYGCNTPEDALKKLTNVKPSQELLVYLNTKFSAKSTGGKAFIIKDGKFTLNPAKYAALKDYDGEFNPFGKNYRSEDKEPTAVINPEPELSQSSLEAATPLLRQFAYVSLTY